MKDARDLAATPAAAATPDTKAACRTEVNSAAESGSDTTIVTYLPTPYQPGLVIQCAARGASVQCGKASSCRGVQGKNV